MHRMNCPDGKRLLARVRGADFAHAGEEESIRLVWEDLPKDPHQRCLDAGCGRGGTAHVVQSSSWGNITGVDIDETSIREARSTYPLVNFQAMDIAQVGPTYPEAFDLIYAFNAFYAFPDQPLALRSLRQAIRPGGTLAIFDYIDRGGFRQSELFQKPETQLWQPLIPIQAAALLKQANWELLEYREINADYQRWYAELVARFSRLRGELLTEFPEDLVDYAAHFYGLMLKAVEDGQLGGAIIYAQAGSPTSSGLGPLRRLMSPDKPSMSEPWPRNH